MKVDSLTLYAYADKSQLRERELWKRFLRLLLPVLLEVDSDEIAEIFDDATLDSAELVVESAMNLNGAPQLVRVISGTLALALGLPAEFGLAAFLESNLPTRIHAPRTKLLRLTDQELISRWLGRFTRIQSDDDFLRVASDWKERLHALQRGDSKSEEPAESAFAKEDSPRETLKGTPVPEEPETVGRRRKRSA
jgi:hypothetical protein